ncbi:glucan biosynthesis protein [Jannaschia aquimarina]|uniref:MdoG protein n=1 Tax=Jannaschia aquimarina TaxID=935700 RepID=A0A0D1CM15_9RHOB|nr:glucan biosynthesis protein G [Jannaschia aquimarina]KIT15797.1 Glucans biosynthesis protein G precursor [Jannaschia aquimarina]SNT42899.1 glucans biosynthesis protein [Jannaschia aquimarina]
MTRRGLLGGLSALALMAGAPVRAEMPRFLSSEPFGADTVREMARDLASRPFELRPSVPRPWRDLTYDEYRTIWFNTSKAVWQGTDAPFRMDLFHPGLYFPRAVEVDVVQDDTAHRLAFDYDLFDRTDRAPDLPIDETMGYSGLRLRTEFDTPGIFREFAVFQGASYFRAIAEGQVYGLSARGLALRTGDAEGEEFPDFTHFWVEEPVPGDDSIVMHALLDSPSVAGAYRFTIQPGPACVMEVEATLFPRVDLDHVGLAPLTSMFLYDGTNRWRFRDFRPAIHDSDGLLIWNGAGEMIWRPLANPTTLQVSSFVDDNPRGFGLMQRADRLSDFADLEAHYERRPCLWIEPSGDWGRGVVRLVEIPSDEEIYDNIVAYWRPREPLAAGSEHSFAYRMTWGTETNGAAPPRRDVPRVTETLIGDNFSRDRQVAAIEFEPHALLEGDLSDIRIFTASNSGAVSDGILQHNPETGGARLSFSFDPADADAVELRAQLTRDDRAASEVWLYRWTRA